MDNGLKIGLINNTCMESPKVALIEERDGDDDDESKALLLSQNEKPKRKVQWLDKNGDKLAQILEFQPSDVSDSDEEDSDSCICIVM